MVLESTFCYISIIIFCAFLIIIHKEIGSAWGVLEWKVIYIHEKKYVVHEILYGIKCIFLYFDYSIKFVFFIYSLSVQRDKNMF